MCIFLSVIGAMAAILEKGHFLAYATNFGIPPRKLLKVMVFYSKTCDEGTLKCRNWDV